MSDTYTFDGSIIDGGILDSIVDFAHATPWLKPIFLIFSHGEVFIILALIFIAWGIVRSNDKKTAKQNITHNLANIYAIPIVVIMAYIVNYIIKRSVHELRPCHSMVNPYIFECPVNLHNYAFPSSHAVLAMSCALGLYWVNKKLSVIAIIIAIVICFSRLYLGAHYPHDVFIGALEGGIIAFFITPKIGEILQKQVLMRVR